MSEINLNKIYEELLNMYGEQGWWPIVGSDGTNPTKTGSIQGYHVKDYTYPKNNDQRFEIILGAILTQNTTWVNVEKALIGLHRIRAINIKGLKNLSDGKLKNLIKPAGYFNQKCKYIRNMISFLDKLGNDVPTREQLLDIEGIGPETADTILLFAYHIPEFIADSYTKKLFVKLNEEFDWKIEYSDLKEYVESNFEKDVIKYQEFHALIVEHGKNYYTRKPLGLGCPLLKKYNPEHHEILEKRALEDN